MNWESRKIAEVSRSYDAALLWLEIVGSWPSSDPSVRRVTEAAQKRFSRGR